jgi:hypothetical protein
MGGLDTGCNQCRGRYFRLVPDPSISVLLNIPGPKEPIAKGRYRPKAEDARKVE